MKRLFLIFPVLLVFFLFAPWPYAQAQPPEPGRTPSTFAWDTLIVVTDSGRRHPFRVELAITPIQQAQGLQWRKSLADDAGMLFDFGAARPAAFWMKNTYVSLDMIFIGADGKIVKIARDTPPLSLDVIPSDLPVRAVLEVRAGTAARLGIQTGDTIEHRIFQ
jgi:uncharacterized membrane protein (UPF0127 family)